MFGHLCLISHRCFQIIPFGSVITSSVNCCFSYTSPGNLAVVLVFPSVFFV